MSARNIPRYWREMKYLYKLIGSRCTKCGATYFPRRNVCRKCGSRTLEEQKIGEKGRLVSYTVIRQAPRGFEGDTPYAVGLVEMDNGVKVISQIVDVASDELYRGMPVELTFRRVREGGEEGIIEYGYKFRPALHEE